MTDINNLITDNIDLWTNAIKKRKGVGRGSSKKIERVGVKKLRELILELAVRGKLVPQDDNDEPASVLLERIAIEKEQLIQDRKIKNTKTLAEITDDEISFELPKSWEWTRLGIITEIGPRNIVEDNTQVSFIPMPLITTNYKGSHGQEVREWREIKKGYTHFADGDIGLAKITPCFENSKLAVFSGLKNGVGGGTTELHIARPFGEYLDRLFIILYLKAPQFLLVGETKMTGSAGQKRVPKDFFSGNPMPFPPLAEQHRIVAKVDELMLLCDQLEQQTEQSISAHQTLVEVLLDTLLHSTTTSAAGSISSATKSTTAENSTRTSETADASAKASTAMVGGNESGTNSRAATCIQDSFQTNWQRISEHFDLLFTTEYSIEQLKQTILQLAVMGKLVPQNPNDEPASVLLEKVAKEKEQLIADKKIKKQKVLPVITDEEKPFELPNGWEWSRIWDVAKIITSGSRDWAKYYSDEGAIFVTMGNLSRGNYRLRLDALRYVKPPVGGEGSRTRLEENDLLLSITGDVGNLGLIPKGFGEAYINQHTCLLRFMTACQNRYFPELMRSPLAKHQFNAPQRGIKNSFRLGDVGEMVVPIPPLTEQHRIVAKVDELMTLCDQLKARLNDAQTTQLHLADAIVSKAVGQQAKNPESKVEIKTMKITTMLTNCNHYINQDDGILAALVKTEGGEADAKAIWNKSGLELPNFYKQLKKEIKVGYINTPAKADFEY